MSTPPVRNDERSSVNPDDRTVYIDPDRTLLIPRPGGRADAAAAPSITREGQVETLQRLVAGLNPLIGAAGELLALVPQLRATTAHADRAALRRQLLERVAAFEERARASGVGKPQVAAARYLLCTFIDEVIAGTPWGADPMPGVKGLLQAFHEDASGAAKSFELLDRLSAEPQPNRDLLELFYVCLALGFEGRHAQQPDARAQLRARMDQLHDLLRPSAARSGPRVLAERWAGQTPGRAPALTVVPVWMALVVGAAVATAAVLFLSTRLARQADTVMQQLHAVRGALRVERQPVAAKPRLAPLLQARVQAGELSVRDEAQRSVVTLAADDLFAAGTAQLEPGAQARLADVARVLAPLAGHVEVHGHSDDRAAESLRFPSNWHLTRERAQAVAQALARSGLDATRLRAEGRADVEPLAPNTSEPARARNRRIEIQLLLARPDGAP